MLFLFTLYREAKHGARPAVLTCGAAMRPTLNTLNTRATASHSRCLLTEIMVIRRYLDEATLNGLLMGRWLRSRFKCDEIARYWKES